MLEKALIGSRKYWGWIFLLFLIIGVGGYFYLQQWSYGLGITGMSRDVSWGLYIANFTFLVGVAASAVMVVLPYYLHNYREFGRITGLGEFLAVSAVVMAISFVLVDLGRPDRAFNMILHPTPNSILFWDMVVLNVYLLLNIVIGWAVMDAESKGEPPRPWVKPLILLSIPWAISIHTVTGFIYCGLVGRPFWNTALMAPRFLASAFAAGPALLILLAFVIRRFTRFEVGEEAIQKLAQIVTYAFIVSIFFLLLEYFTTFYGQATEHMSHLKYLLFGLDGKTTLVPWIWASLVLAAIAIVLLVIPKTRKRKATLAVACIAVFVSIWIDKGLGLIIPGFVPSPTGTVFEYWPTVPETLITLGVWGFGTLVLTVLYKVYISVHERLEAEEFQAQSGLQKQMSQSRTE